MGHQRRARFLVAALYQSDKGVREVVVQTSEMNEMNGMNAMSTNNEAAGTYHLLAQGDAVSQALAVLLVLISIASWSVICIGVIAHLRARRAASPAMQSFWDAASRTEALNAIRSADRSGLFSMLAADAVSAMQAFEQQSDACMGGKLDASAFIARSLQQSAVLLGARLGRGSGFLSAAGAAAPCIGLIGTFWGLYHALVSASVGSQAGVENLSTAVGEAMLMTAAGLLVAVPALLGALAFSRSNRLLLARLGGFALALQASLAMDVKRDARAGLEDASPAGTEPWREAAQKASSLSALLQ